MIITSLIFLLFLLFLYYKSKKELRLELELKNVKETTKLKNRFIESLSQDIKTPITIINGYLDLIEKNSIHPAEVVNWTKIGQKNTELLMNKFNSFLSLIKLDEKQKLNESVKTESISKYIEEITNTFSYLASTKNIGLYFKSNTTDDLKVSYNYERIEKILNNLITNAIKFTDSKNNIFIEIKIDKTSLSIIVKDEGIGIAKDEQKLIFDRFYQSKKNKTIGGFGIGLSLVKELTNSLNGMIELDSKEDIGSIFKVNIPLEPIENIDLYLNPLPPEYNELSKIVKTLTTCNNKFPKILIVEESLEMIAYLKDLLGNFLECHIAHNGREALLQIKEVDFNLIISEYAIPIINGKELKIELNKNEEYEKIPFIMLTAASVKNFTDIKLSLGINDYIVKPFSSNELITRIRGALENNIMLIKIQNNEDKVEFDSHVTQLLDKINIFVLVNISDTNYNVGDLASDCGYGQKQFGKIIKDKTGMSPVNLILEIRLLKAYELLLNKKYATIMEIIYAVGLTNRSYFNKAFTTRFGIKPKELTTKLISF
jgi:AraC-like DNA-binding protein/nitrogen-specific signal transduction histidine kinase